MLAFRMSQGKRFFRGIIPVLLFCFVVLPKTEAATLSGDELFGLMKQRREMVTSGKVVFQTVRYEWQDEEAYTIFAEELKRRTFISSKDIKEWFVKNKDILLVKAKKYGHTENVYFFDGIRDHLLVTPCFEKLDYIIDGRVKPPQRVRIDEIQIPDDIKTLVASEYSYDENVVKKYKKYSKGYCTLSIYPGEGGKGLLHHNYLNVWDLDLSLIDTEKMWTDEVSKNWTSTIIPLSTDTYLMSSTSNKAKGMSEKITIDVSLGGVIVYIRDYSEQRTYRELIFTGFSEVNGLVNLPGLVSSAEFQYDEEGNFTKIGLTIHLIHFWEIKPVSKRELEIFPCPLTRIIDYRSDPPHYYIYDLELERNKRDRSNKEKEKDGDVKKDKVSNIPTILTPEEMSNIRGGACICCYCTGSFYCPGMASGECEMILPYYCISINCEGFVAPQSDRHCEAWDWTCCDEGVRLVYTTGCEKYCKQVICWCSSRESGSFYIGPLYDCWEWWCEECLP